MEKLIKNINSSLGEILDDPDLTRARDIVEGEINKYIKKRTKHLSDVEKYILNREGEEGLQRFNNDCNKNI